MVQLPIGDAYIDSFHITDTYTKNIVHAAQPINPNPTPRDDRTQNPPNIMYTAALIEFSRIEPTGCMYMPVRAHMCVQSRVFLICV